MRDLFSLQTFISAGAAWLVIDLVVYLTVGTSMIWAVVLRSRA